MITLTEATELFEKTMNKKALHTSLLHGGVVGITVRIDTDDHAYVLKYNAKLQREETVDDRVYGSNPRNFDAAHALLLEHKIPTFTVYARGDTDTHTYAIFDLLDGTEISEEILHHPVYATSLAQIHSIHRSFQGWVAQEKPYDISWSDAFRESIANRLHDVQEILSPALYEKVTAYIATQGAKLRDPAYFVLSHTDGLQALFYKDEEDWYLRGVIDVEDYQFTDQRFVLSGVTLTHKVHGYTLSPTFWNTYRAHTTFDESFSEFETLFHIYYVLVWIKVFEKDSVALEKCIKLLEDVI